MAFNDLSPPPSIVDLVKEDTNSDSIWKTWLNSLYEKVKDLVAEELQKSAFGELLVGSLTPAFQSDFSYNINPDLWLDKSNNGSASIDNHRLKLSTGAAANQSGQINSKIALKYNAGMGANVRFTGIFTNDPANLGSGYAGSTQIIGVGDSGDGFFIGYNGADFGILRRYGGHQEVRTLTVTIKSTDAENITITLDGDVDATVTVRDATTGDATTTANDIAAHDYSNLGRGWEAHSDGATVVFVSYDSSIRTGVYSLSGATTAVGTFAQTIAGVAQTDVWVAQESWSEDTGNGQGILPVMNWTKGNVFQIRYQWLGYGMITFYVEDPATGQLIAVHKIPYANANTLLSVNNPTLSFSYLVENGNNTSDLVLYAGSVGGFTEGIVNGGHIHHGASATKASVGTAETPILTIHNSIVYQGVPNRVRIKMISASMSADGNKPVTFRLRKDVTLTASSFNNVDADGSTVKFDIAATGIDAIDDSDEQFAVGLSKVGSDILDLSTATFFLNPNEKLTLTAQSAAGGSADVVVSFNWEDRF